jgi:hypothetical protein
LEDLNFSFTRPYTTPTFGLAYGMSAAGAAAGGAATLTFSGSGGGGCSGKAGVESETGVLSAGTVSPVLGLDVDDGEASDEAPVPDFLRFIFSLSRSPENKNSPRISCARTLESISRGAESEQPNRSSHGWMC